jgi:hypothetical protein
MLKETELEQWIAKFNASGKLPETKIHCSNAHCTTLTTMFGENLLSRVVKYDCDIRKLLTTFKCKNCRGGGGRSAELLKMIRSKQAGEISEE